MSEYKTFSNNEYPKVGEVCIVYRTNALDESKGLVGPTESFFGKFSIEDGIPYWGAGHRCKPIDQWKLVEFEASPKTQAEPPAQDACPLPKDFVEKISLEYKGNYGQASVPVMIPDSGIKFEVSWDHLQGEDPKTGKCFTIPCQEAFDALQKIAVGIDKPQAEPPADPNEFTETTFGCATVRCYNDGRTETLYGGKVFSADPKEAQFQPAINTSEWKSWSQEIEQRDRRIKYLEDTAKEQVEQIGQLEVMLKSHDYKYKNALEVLAIKDAKITKLQIVIQGLNARLNSNG